MKRTRRNQKGGSVFSHKYLDLTNVQVGDQIEINLEDPSMIKQINNLFFIDKENIDTDNLKALQILSSLLFKGEFKVTYIDEHRNRFEIEINYVDPNNDENGYTTTNFKLKQTIINAGSNDGPGAYTKPYISLTPYALDTHSERKILKLYDSGFKVKKVEGGNKKNTRRKKRKYNKN